MVRPGRTSKSTLLGEFLVARRARLRPADVGLPEGTGLRRTQGLRREELATLAGLSVQYYIRLEQGRETNPSGVVLDGLASALRLNREEHAHLYALANHTAQRVLSPATPSEREVRPGIRRLLQTVRPWPAYVLSRTSDILGANPEALALFPGMADWPAERRNTIRYLFLHPAARRLYADWEEAAVSTSAQLRSLLADEPEAPELTALVEELSRDSAEFGGIWQRYDVRQRRSAQARFRHPEIGEVTFDYEVLRLGVGGQRMTIYQAEPGSADHDAMRRLSEMASRDGADDG
ncbi:helix-turn-helix transcriptional regulator [Amycolatopsis rhizosphaerae]|uniref:Helix-turn-helix transcriptional regulator n=1 Tax=Amycolatopsis rhizosphaerae TaxID=2053003 RepID=A0A558DJK7_9PSEU|nr:helix-turn-helix domain-containing protein [Amycolatopsis rhizosphaerae]TVT61163.1 helix-turn-helix transcriptional regulator [Amycolatopsis rhizosphaerae]